jgi:hypothetical protein
MAGLDPGLSGLNHRGALHAIATVIVFADFFRPGLELADPP